METSASASMVRLGVSPNHLRNVPSGMIVGRSKKDVFVPLSFDASIGENGKSDYDIVVHEMRTIHKAHILLRVRTVRSLLWPFGNRFPRTTIKVKKIEITQLQYEFDLDGVYVY